MNVIKAADQNLKELLVVMTDHILKERLLLVVMTDECRFITTDQNVKKLLLSGRCIILPCFNCREVPLDLTPLCFSCRFDHSANLCGCLCVCVNGDQLITVWSILLRSVFIYKFDEHWSVGMLLFCCCLI